MIFLFLIPIVLAIIRFQEGIILDFDYSLYPQFNCYGGRNFTTTINFADSFVFKPQVILTLLKLDLENTNNQYYLNLQNITIQSFKLQVFCPFKRLYAIRIQWYAFDNNQITVLNIFNDKNLKNVTLRHYNRIAEKGFISLLGLGFKGPVDLQLNIQQITQDQVSIVINNPSNLHQNILSLDYQVVLGPNSLINLLDTVLTIQNYTSSQITLQPESFFMNPFIGFNFTNLDIIRLNTTTYLTQNQISFKIENWCGQYTTNIHQQLWLSFCNSVRIFDLKYLNFIQSFEPNSQQIQALSVKIQELNQQISSVGSFDISINPIQNNIINIAIQGNCVQNAIIISTSTDKNEFITTFQKKCELGLNYFSLQATYQPTNIVNEKLQISIQKNNCSIYQILQRTNLEIIQLLKLEIEYV